MTLDDLTRDEQDALGGLIRMIVRGDGDFSEAEEAAINAIGDELGGQARMWRVISQSAQACPEENAIRACVAKGQRPDARVLILGVIERIAASDETSDRERELLRWLRSSWT